MKTKVLSLFLMLLMTATVAFATNKTEQFTVKGACGMCETRIEKVALSVEGVTKADWDRETQKIVVVYDDEVTQPDAIHQAIRSEERRVGKVCSCMRHLNRILV